MSDELRLASVHVTRGVSISARDWKAGNTLELLDAVDLQVVPSFLQVDSDGEYVGTELVQIRNEQGQTLIFNITAAEWAEWDWAKAFADIKKAYKLREKRPSAWQAALKKGVDNVGTDEPSTASHNSFLLFVVHKV